MVIIGEKIPWKEINLLHFAYYLLQIEFGRHLLWYLGISTQRKYWCGTWHCSDDVFMNLVANIAEVAEGLKYITPFGYCEGADIVSNGYLDGTLITIGLIFGMVGIVAAYWKYTRKDIHSA